MPASLFAGTSACSAFGLTAIGRRRGSPAGSSACVSVSRYSVSRRPNPQKITLARGNDYDRGYNRSDPRPTVRNLKSQHGCEEPRPDAGGRSLRDIGQSNLSGSLMSLFLQLSSSATKTKQNTRRSMKPTTLCSNFASPCHNWHHRDQHHAPGLWQAFAPRLVPPSKRRSDADVARR